MNPGKMDKWLTVTAFDATAGVYKKVRNAYGAYQYKSRVVLSPHSAALPVRKSSRAGSGPCAAAA